jgi:hypothetical protein
MNGNGFPGDTIGRQVLFAVELVDPVTGDLVSQPASVAADGLGNGSVINLSGRYVFLAQPGNPGTVRIDLHDLPYEPISSSPPNIAGGQLLLRLTLQPTAAYPFAASSTLIRGRLVDGLAAVAGASVGVSFADGSANNQALPALTNRFGTFVVLLRLDPLAVANGDAVSADLTIAFTRNGTTKSRPGLRAEAGSKVAMDVASKARVTEFDWAAL